MAVVLLPGTLAAEAGGQKRFELRAATVGEALRQLPQVGVSAEAHAFEHSLEVHLPFLQATLDSFTLVPLTVGHAAPRVSCHPINNTPATMKRVAMR